MPMRILQVVSEMGPTGGGVEVWLLQILRQIDRREFRMDFLVHTPQPKAFDEEVRSLGSRVLSCIRPLYLWRYPFEFRRIVRENGPYEVIHSHTLFGGLVMRLAKGCGVPVRVAHSHSDVDGFRVDGDPFRGPFVRFTNRWARTCATHRLGCSRRAVTAMFGDANAGQVLYYGINLAPFRTPVDSRLVRDELDLPRDAFVVGHVGRFQPQKNHEFLIEIAEELIRRQPRTRLILVGDGPLRPEIEGKVRQLGLADRVHFLGVRRDVPRLLLGAMDTFVLPSHYEGLPLVGIEAQAAGLPCVLSDTITEELDIVPNLVRRASPARPASAWADLILRRETAPIPSRAQALAQLEQSPFDIRNAVSKLQEFYSACRERGAWIAPVE